MLRKQRDLVVVAGIHSREAEEVLGGLRGDIALYYLRNGNLLDRLGIVDRLETRDYAVAVPTTYFIDSNGRIEGLVASRTAADRPSKDLLLFGAQEFSRTKEVE